jgi:hypothetical protein
MPSDMGARAESFATMMAALKTSFVNIETIAKDFPNGGPRGLEAIKANLAYIAENLDKKTIGSISEAFSSIDLELPKRVDSLVGGFDRLPNLLIQIERFADRVDRAKLARAHQNIKDIAWALSPLADLGKSLTFKAPNIEYFEREIANLILTLGAATHAIPKVLELRAVIEARLKGKGKPNGTPKTINEALTGAPGAGNTIGDASGNEVTTMDATTGKCAVSMEGAESRLDTIIKEQQQTNRLMQQLISAMTAPAVRHQQSGVAPRRTFVRAGAIKQNVDSAWNSDEMLTT